MDTTQTTLLDKCRTGTQLTPTEIDSIVALIAGRCGKATRDKLKANLSDIRGLSKTGHLSHIKFNNNSGLYEAVVFDNAYRGLDRDLRQLLGA